MKNSLNPFLLFFFCLLTFSLANAQESSGQKAYTVTVNDKYENIQMAISEFRNATFGIHSFADPSAKYILKGFNVKCSGQPDITNKGNKLNSDALGSLQRVNIGDKITISIPVDFSPKGVLLDKTIFIIVKIIR